MISVIIPCFNATRMLSLQLDALSTQSGAPPFEVVLVDNRSTDDLAGLARSYMDRFPHGLRVVEASEHQGVSYARNVGAEVAEADHLMFCDADDVVSEWWIAQGIQTFSVADPWSGSAILLTDDAFQGTLAQIRSAFGDSPIWEPPWPVSDPTVFPVLMGGNFGCTKALFKSLGGFDQSFPTTGEDNDFAFRAHRSGLAVLTSPTVRIAYRGKWELRSRVRLAFRAAQAHALLATRYDTWSGSPFPQPVRGLVRCGLAAARMAVQPSRRDFPGLGIRTAESAGLAWGAMKFKVLKKIPEPQIGVGLSTSPEGAR